MILVRPDGELEEREDDDALSLIKTGGLALNLDQSAPPFAIIKLLKDLAGDIARLGSSRSTPEMLQKAQENLFKGQVKQNIVGGRSVIWRLQNQLPKELHSRLFHIVGSTQNLYAAVEAVWQHRLDKVDEIVEHHSAFSESVLLEDGLALLREGRAARARGTNFWREVPLDRGIRWQYKVVGSDWATFHLQFLEVREVVAEAKRLACEQARILVSEFHNGIERLVEPERAFDVLHQRTKEPEFVFSADLPPIFYSQQEVAALVRNARLWMEKVSKVLEPEAKLARKEDMIIVAAERSRMTDTAARTAYSKADVRNKGSKRLPPEAYISIERLRYLIP